MDLDDEEDSKWCFHHYIHLLHWRREINNHIYNVEKWRSTI